MFVVITCSSIQRGDKEKEEGKGIFIKLDFVCINPGQASTRSNQLDGVQIRKACYSIRQIPQRTHDRFLVSWTRWFEGIMI